MKHRAIRKNHKASDGWNGGDIDELVAMFKASLLWDGNHPSKSSRDYLIEAGFAFRVDGQTALTGKGKIAALTCWPMPRVWFRMWRRGVSPLFTYKDPKKSTT